MNQPAHNPLIALALGSAMLAGCGRGNAIEPASSADAEALYQAALPATAEVLVGGRVAGSGWIASVDGLVMTAAHLVRPPGAPEPSLEILRPGGDLWHASLVGLDRAHDLALLRIEGAEHVEFASLPVAEQAPRPGAEIHLLGAPQYRHAVLISGQVAREGTTFEYFRAWGHYVEVLHVMALTPPGTSGAPWLDGSGAVVGQQVGTMTDGGASSGVAHLAPALAIARLLRVRGTIPAAALGAPVEELWEVPPEVAARHAGRDRGLVVRNPPPDGPAASAGIRDGDLLVAADDRPLHWRDDLQRAVAALAPGATLRVSVLRPGDHEPHEVVVQLGVRGETEPR